MTKLLIVDDHPQNRYMLQVLLANNGFEVETAADGAEALALAHQSPPDLIISDILMPVMDGFGLCRAWMQDAQLQDIPFVFYTATYTDPRDEELALSLGAARYIVKPVELDRFVDMLREVLEAYYAGTLVTSRQPPEAETEYLRLYNRVLIRKLEDKMIALERSNRRLAALYQASNGLAALRPPDELIHLVLRAIVEIAGFEEANYFHHDEDQGRLILLDAVGFSDEVLAAFKEQLRFTVGEERGLVGLVGQTRQPLIVPDTTREPRWITISEIIRSALFVPVLHKNRLLAIVAVFSREPDAFDEEDARNITTLTNDLAIAIENHRLLEQVRESELFYRTVLESSADAIVSVDPEGKIAEWNRGAEQILGYTRAEVVGQPLFSVIPEHERRSMAEVLQTMHEQGFVRGWRAQQGTKDGRLLDVEITVTDMGPDLGFTGILRDITERVRAQEKLKEYAEHLEEMVDERTQELRAAQEQLVRQERLAVLGQLAGGVAHELRNPLGVITNAIYYLKLVQPEADETVREYLDLIESESRRAAQIGADLLDYARIRPAQREPAAVSDLVARVLDRQPPPENVTVTAAIPADLPPAFVDPRQIEQVLANLVINAYQAMPDGGELTISVEREEGDEETRGGGEGEKGRAAPGHLLPLSPHLRVSVSDTGTGISPENMARLFEPLFTTKLRGIGLGLAISKRLVEANGGIIEAASVAGQGSTLTLRLPTAENHA